MGTGQTSWKNHTSVQRYCCWVNPFHSVWCTAVLWTQGRACFLVCVGVGWEVGWMYRRKTRSTLIPQGVPVHDYHPEALQPCLSAWHPALPSFYLLLPQPPHPLALQFSVLVSWVLAARLGAGVWVTSAPQSQTGISSLLFKNPAWGWALLRDRSH